MALSSSSRPARMPKLQSTKLWKEQRGEISPDRTVVWTEPSSNGKQLKTDKRVPVIYYLNPLFGTEIKNPRVRRHQFTQ